LPQQGRGAEQHGGSVAGRTPGPGGKGGAGGRDGVIHVVGGGERGAADLGGGPSGVDGGDLLAGGALLAGDANGHRETGSGRPHGGDDAVADGRPAQLGVGLVHERPGPVRIGGRDARRGRRRGRRRWGGQEGVEGGAVVVLEADEAVVRGVLEQ